ncbi:MAG: hypothetical protein GTO14_14540 [Anaerolineales bacterium]|nr:hypothetical protein [Anaerolineales bacterium]
MEWFDASIGKSLASGTIDVPVKSWGIFLGVLGEKHKHVILAQNNFRYTNGLYDIDYTAVPVSWTINVTVNKKQEIAAEEAKVLLTSFLRGRSRTLKRKIVNHEKLH